MDHESGNNKFDESVEDAHLIVEDFDYTEETYSFYTESQFVNLDGDTEKLDIPHFVGDLRALMVDDSEDEVVLDSDDEKLLERKDGTIRGSLWRRASAVSTPSVEIRSSAGSNLTEKVTNNSSVTRSIENDLIQSNENVVNVDKIIVTTDLDTKSLKGDEFVIESQEPGEESQANALNFVDQFVSVCVVNSSPEFKISKIDALRSPLPSCAKGSHSLARKANLMDKIGIATFDWDDDNEPDHGGEFFLEKRNELDFQREERFNEELPKCPSRNGGNEGYGINMFDVGFNTQMAAEAIESLLYAPPSIMDANEHKDLENRTSEQILLPLRDNFDSQNGDIWFKQKRVAKNQKKVNIELPSTKKTQKRKSLNKTWKAKRKQEEDSEKENLQGGYKRRESVRKMHQEVKTFSPVACRTRSGSLLKHSKRIEDTCNLVHERKTGDLDKDLFLVKRTKCPNAEATSGPFKFGIRNWPKKKRTSRNMKNSVVENRQQLLKKKSTSSSLRNELTKLGLAESSPDIISKDLGRRRSKVEIRVMLSQNLEDDVVKQQRKIMTELGISMATDCSDATHFVADRFARTKKMLEAMAFGKPIVTPLWLESCEQTRCVIDEKSYILKDAKKEKEIGFNMTVSLSRARSHPLLKDRSVFITPNVEPDRKTIRNLVKALQGQVMDGIQHANMEYKISDNILILSCEYDYEICVPFLDKGAAVYSWELLLNGIIIQKLEYSRYQLFTDHVIMKRYTRRRKNRSQQLLGS